MTFKQHEENPWKTKHLTNSNEKLHGEDPCDSLTLQN